MAEEVEPTEAEVDAVVEESRGDLRAAIRALLHDIAVLAADFGAHVSRGYVRRGVAEGRRRATGETSVKE